MKMEDIGFYTLGDTRCKHVSAHSPMWRCEMILTDTCNFSCPYCRGHKHGAMDPEVAMKALSIWCDEGLKNIRFSGGEPLTYKYLDELVNYAAWTCDRVAISSNGSFPLQRYKELIDLGVNDFSISLDSCCSSFGDLMAGGITGAWEKVVNNIRELSKLTYVTVGIVVTKETVSSFVDTVKFAYSLGVADIRVIPAAQEKDYIEYIGSIPQEILDDCPILAYRVKNLLAGRGVRGIKEEDCHVCCLGLDDSVVAGDSHYPCVIHLREGGGPIGKIGPNMRQERVEWVASHDSYTDPICKKNCLDTCIAHNNKCAGCPRKGMTMEKECMKAYREGRYQTLQSRIDSLK